MLTLPSYDITGIKTSSEALALIDQNLADLRVIAANTDFSVKAQVENFSRNIAFLKQYYEKAESLLIQEGKL